MFPFSTEFSVLPSADRTAFVAEVIAWFRGMRHQTVFSGDSVAELDGDNIHILSPTEEEFRMRELRSDGGWSAIGFRYDLPDECGCVWRTECVLKRAVAEGGQDLIRLRTQCIATTPGARLFPPRKPYLIKALLKNGWGGRDKLFNITDQPIWLKNRDADLMSAISVTLGKATKWLPNVYVSATGESSWLFTRQQIEKLAYDLGGVAHVVVEPDRAFSFDLRDETDGRNAYGGTVGLSVPGQGIIRRYYLGWQIQDVNGLAAAIVAAASTLRSQMPSFGWDWTELQEQALRAQREREKDSLTEEEWSKLHKEEIDNLQDRIHELELQLSARPTVSLDTDEAELSNDNFVQRIGPEVYSGEISDRLRYAAKITLSVAEQIGLDKRTKVILERIIERLPVSTALVALLEDLERATKDPKRVASELTSLLVRHGYLEKSDNKHIRLEASKGSDGLDAITIPKTPSENRGLKNLRKQIERTLGISKLGD